MRGGIVKGKKLLQIFLSSSSSPSLSISHVYQDRQGDLSCTCQFFNKYGECKHTDYVQEEMDANYGEYPMEISKRATLTDVQRAKESYDDYRNFVIEFGKTKVL